MTNTYWENKGTHTNLYEKLLPIIPMTGECPKESPCLEQLRRAANAYYDTFNNGGCNRADDIRSVLGVAITKFRKGNDFDWDAIHAIVEPKMDEIILMAAKEQGIS